jgi:hypothetical protein
VSDPQQELNLSRVTERIQGLILSFARDRVACDRGEFHMTELTSFVSRHHVIAPDSAGRVLRLLRAQGQLDYQVTNRRRSEYRITKVSRSAA